MIDHESYRLLAAGAALDDLAPDERRLYEAHDGICPDCRELEDDLGGILVDLALAGPERMPPPSLLPGILRALPRDVDPAPDLDRRARGVVVPFRRPSSRRPVLAALAVAAALGIVAVGLGARNLGIQQDLDRTTARVASLESTLAGQGSAMAVALNPDHVTVALHAEPLAPDAVAAVVFVPGGTSSYLVARNLPATPVGHVYQLWYADLAGVHPLQAASFDGDGPFVAPIGVDLASTSAVMVTLEVAGGAVGEPGPQVVFGEL